jgi:hypothetical protein
MEPASDALGAHATDDGISKRRSLDEHATDVSLD